MRRVCRWGYGNRDMEYSTQKRGQEKMRHFSCVLKDAEDRENTYRYEGRAVRSEL